MRPEWREYWKENLKASRSVFLALGVSVIMWLVQLPNMDESVYLRNFLISCMYGLVIYAYIWVLYATVWAVVTHYKLNADKLIKPTWTVHISLSLGGMAAGLLTAKWLEAQILDQLFSTSGILESVMYGSFLALMFMFYYAYKHSNEENIELKAAKAESELHVLKNQMQPHFLFNSLNSLSELIETNKDSASDMAMKLSDLYREILENSRKQLASLGSEISIIEKYLELESLRFGKRLQYDINVPENSEKILIPPLVLQTLVENAVKHGIASSVEGGKVEVSVKANGAPGYNLTVKNTGTDSCKSKGSGTGLENTKARLDLLYGDKHNFQIQSVDNSVQASFWFSGASANV